MNMTYVSVVFLQIVLLPPPPSGHSNQLAAASTTVFKPIPEKQPAVNVATEWQLRDDGSELFPPFPTILLSGKQQSLSRMCIRLFVFKHKISICDMVKGKT